MCAEKLQEISGALRKNDLDIVDYLLKILEFFEMRSTRQNSGIILYSRVPMFMFILRCDKVE